MKKLLAIMAIAFLASCGGGAKEEATDTAAVAVDTTAPAVDTTAAPDTTAAADTAAH